MPVTSVRIESGQVLQVSVASDTSTQKSSAKIWSLNGDSQDVFVRDLDAGQSTLLGPYINITEFRIEKTGNVTIAPLGRDFSTPYPLSSTIPSSSAVNIDLSIFTPEEFGAKGDTIGSSTGVMSGGWFSDVTHYFTTDDIGKEFYTDTTVRSVSAVDGAGKCQMSPAISSGSTITWLMGTDDTVAMQAALDAARDVCGLDTTENAGATYGLIRKGGIVQLGAGKSYMVGNSSASYNGGAGKLSALKISRRTGLRGAGAGFGTSAIVLRPNSYGHVIANNEPGEGTNGYADFITISNLTIQGYQDWNPNALDGIYLRVTFNGYDAVDPYNRVLDVMVVRAKRNGFYFRGRGELIVERCFPVYCNNYGFHITGLNDYKFISCNSVGNQKTGFRIESAGGGSYVTCRSFFNGAGGLDNIADCAAWYVSADQMRNGQIIFNGCEGQENRGSSWVIDNCGMNHFINCMGQDPGRESGNLVTTGPFPSVISAWHIKGNGACLNSFSNCYAGPAVAVFNMTNNWGIATDAVYIEGVDGSGNGPQKNRGDIYTMSPTTQGGVTDPGTQYRGGYGAKGGSGTSNGQNTQLKVDGVACT